MNEFAGDGTVYTAGHVSPDHQQETVSHPGWVMFDGPWVHVESPPQSGKLKSFPAHAVIRVTWNR